MPLVERLGAASCYLPPLRWAIAFEGSAVRSEISETVRVCEHAGASGKTEVSRRAAQRRLPLLRNVSNDEL